MNKILIAVLIVVLLITFAYYWRSKLSVKVDIDNHIFYVDVAVTPAQKELGLGYRDSMAQDHGMLFPYDHPEQYSFWMKGMRFPLDMIWIRDKTIIDITKNIPIATSDYLPTYSPHVPADKVLEVNAGTTDRLNIKVGDAIKILF